MKLTFEDLTLTGEAEADDFGKGDITSVVMSAAVFRSEPQAEQAFDRAASDEFVTCLTDYLKQQSDDDATIKDAHFGRLNFPRLGDESAAYQIVAEVEASGLSPSIYVDVVFIREGRAVLIIGFFDAFSAFDDREKERLARIVADRASGASTG